LPFKAQTRKSFCFLFLRTNKRFFLKKEAKTSIRWRWCKERSDAMQFGVAVSTAADSWKVVARAEELGFRRAWFYDTQMISADCFVAMGAAAVKTSRIRLATGVAVPSNRIPAVTANALATLNALAPGRIDFGIGTGFSARRAMGLGAVKLADMAEHARVVMALLRGETVETEIEGAQRKIRLLNPEAGLINIRDAVGLYVSAMGPRARRLTAELGAGWITLMASAAAGMASLREMQAAWAASGRVADDLDAVGFAYGAVLAPGEAADSPRVIAECGPRAATLLHRMVDEALLGLPSAMPPPDWAKAAVDEYVAAILQSEPRDAQYLNNHRGHLVYVRPDERKAMSAELIRYTSLTGTQDEVIAWVEALRDAGYREFVACIVPGQERALEDWARVMRAVGG
jgi:5,10-methylenetetrahydromethanopterin reductase